MILNFNITKYNFLIWLPIHVISIIYVFYIGLSYFDCLIILFFNFLFGCIGIEIGYHRYFSHNAFKTSALFEKILAVLGIWGAQDSVIWWRSLHINHHLHTDQEQDIHSPIHGKWNSYFLWIWKKHQIRMYFNKSMIKSHFYSFLHRYYVLVYWLPIFLISIFSIKYAVIIFVIPGLICIHQTNIVNLFSHWPIDSKCQTNNNTIIGLLSWGLGFHKNHHEHQSRYMFHNLDISGKIIALFKGRSNLFKFNIRKLYSYKLPDIW